LLFNPGDSAQLGKCIRALQRPETAASMGVRARGLFERTFTPERHRDVLFGIYSRALAAGSAVTEHSDSSES
jgi:hypothetical protein